MKKFLFILIFAGIGSSAAADTIVLPPQGHECDAEIDWCFLVYCKKRDCFAIPAADIATEVQICLDFRTIVKGDEFINACRSHVSKRLAENLTAL